MVASLEQESSDTRRFDHKLFIQIWHLLLKEFGVESGRVDGLTGVWIEGESKNARKICAMGVKSSRWVTMHGIGFNVNTDLNFFSHIIPCGIEDKAVTSMQRELGREIEMNAVSLVLQFHLAKLFDFTIKLPGNE